MALDYNQLVVMRQAYIQVCTMRGMIRTPADTEEANRVFNEKCVEHGFIEKTDVNV